MDFDAYVRSLGLDPVALIPEQQTALEAAWRASLRAPIPVPTPVPNPNPQPNPVTHGRTQAEVDLEKATLNAESETRRKGDIVALCQRFMLEAPDRARQLQDYATLAINGGMTADQAELQLRRQSYGNGPLAFSPSTPKVDDKVIEIAVARTLGVNREALEKDYTDQALSAADRTFRGGCGLQRLVVTCARANGYRDASSGDFVGMHNCKRLLSAAFRTGGDGWDAMATSGFGPSTYDLSGILSNVMNKSIRDYFNAIEQVWRQISAIRPVNDFKQITGYALTGDLDYKEVAPGGEVKHGTLGEETYTNQAKLYAIMLGIDYQHLRNDDMSAFAAVNKRLGRGGATKLNKVFWQALMTTVGSFWSTGNGNYINHADYEFTLDKLANAHVAWEMRTDPNGNPMGDRAKFLLTPKKWELASRRFMRSTTISDDSGSGDTNQLAGMWEPISSTYLSDATLTGYSVDDYYLISDPMDLAVIETVFLDGQEIPTIEMAEPDLSHLGIMVRGVHAFGVNRQEKRGGYRFKQTA